MKLAAVVPELKEHRVRNGHVTDEADALQFDGLVVVEAVVVAQAIRGAVPGPCGGWNAAVDRDRLGPPLDATPTNSRLARYRCCISGSPVGLGIITVLAAAGVRRHRSSKPVSPAHQSFGVGHPASFCARTRPVRRSTGQHRPRKQKGTAPVQVRPAPQSSVILQALAAPAIGALFFGTHAPTPHAGMPGTTSPFPSQDSSPLQSEVSSLSVLLVHFGRQCWHSLPPQSASLAQSFPGIGASSPQRPAFSSNTPTADRCPGRRRSSWLEGP